MRPLCRQLHVAVITQQLLRQLRHSAPARILAKYAKQVPALELIAGVVEGNYNDQAGIQALSTIPSREELFLTSFYKVI